MDYCSIGFFLLLRNLQKSHHYQKLLVYQQKFGCLVVFIQFCTSVVVIISWPTGTWDSRRARQGPTAPRSTPRRAPTPTTAGTGKTGMSGFTSVCYFISFAVLLYSREVSVRLQKGSPFVIVVGILYSLVKLLKIQLQLSRCWHLAVPSTQPPTQKTPTQSEPKLT